MEAPMEAKRMLPAS